MMRVGEWQQIDHLPDNIGATLSVFRMPLAESLTDTAPLLAQLEDPERERFHGFKAPAAAAAFLQTRALLRRLLAAALQCPPQALRLGATPLGKPILLHPAAPALGFNATHTQGWAGIAIGPHPNIGLDFEAHDPIRSLDGIAAQRYTPHEQAQLAAITDPAARRRAFYDIWTAKEACLKALGQGIGSGVASIEIHLEPTGPRAQDHPTPFTLYRLPFETAYSATLALAAPSQSAGAPRCYELSQS